MTLEKHNPKELFNDVLVAELRDGIVLVEEEVANGKKDRGL